MKGLVDGLRLPNDAVGGKCMKTTAKFLISMICMPKQWINNLIIFYNKLGTCEAEGEDIQAFAG